ncbi:response regulator transcription factor [Thalassotalea profundi]|uniref:DNA-binding response regulator n=1 Tax=Thalassotalea profundi TaxID=2036687 RepID=A0ABQ3IM15_9GAMM|nr:response regulator transcription factor [Thalassotalea profundi]GHE86421.1 DNA-binding response regulator [Thalassotalea profundi]
MTHILLVEDDERLAKLIQKFLKQNNFDVTVLHSGEQAIDYIKNTPPDLAILDVMLPKVDGFSICRSVRQHFHNPILFLTAKDSDFDHVLGLEIGADDYLIKPIEPHVLLARINTRLRQSQPIEKPVDSIQFDELHINKAARKVLLNGKEVELTSHEFELLWLLALNAGEPQNREYIHKKMIDREYDGLDRSVDVRVSRLRKKLNDNLENPYRIITVWGKGYMLSKTAWTA